MKRAILLILGAGLLLPASAEAQRRSSHQSNSFAFSPYGGVWKDAWDISVDDDNTGYILGFRVGYDITRRGRLIADVAYAHSDNVANTPRGTMNYNVYDNEWIMTTGGAEYDILPGNTSVTFGAQAGVAWRKVALEEQVGFPAVDDSGGGYSSNFLVVPRISVRHSFTPRTALDVSVVDHILPENEVDHSPGLTIGFWFR